MRIKSTLKCIVFGLMIFSVVGFFNSMTADAVYMYFSYLEGTPTLDLTGDEMEEGYLYLFEHKDELNALYGDWSEYYAMKIVTSPDYTGNLIEEKIGSAYIPCTGFSARHANPNTPESNVSRYWAAKAAGQVPPVQTSNSSNQQTTETIPAVAKCEHEYSDEITKEATCAESGEITYSCPKCGDSYTEEIPATGDHDYVEEITIEASCTHTGVLTNTCSICGAHTSKIIPRLEHQYSAETTTPASCETNGVLTYSCSLCGDSYEEEIPKTGHHEGQGIVTKETTLFSAGEREYRCTECGICLRKEEIPSKLKSLFTNK